MTDVTSKHMAVVRRLAKDPKAIGESLAKNHIKTHAVHAALGLAGEAGEVVDLVKKFAMNGHALDQAKLHEELGDVMFYLQMLVQLSGGNLDSILEANREKLTARYANGYSDEASRKRVDVDDDEYDDEYDGPFSR